MSLAKSPGETVRYSFVIPTYNKKERLRRTLEALNHLEGYSPDEYEAIVVDDGSAGDVFNAIRGVNRNYRLNYLYLDRCEDSCRSRSRNYGIDAARGKYIVFIDDDVVVDSCHLQELDRCYRLSENLVIIGTIIDCPAHLVDNRDMKEVREMAFKGSGTHMLELRHLTFQSLSYNLASQRYPWMMTVTCNLSVPKKLLMGIGGFDENFKKWGYEDLELGFRLYRKGAHCLVNPRLEAMHQSHLKSPEGENNYSYFVEKCGEVFSKIPPVKLLSLYTLHTDLPGRLKPFRRYQGNITGKQVLDFKEEGELGAVKNKIREGCEEKGCEMIVNDYVETTDLDLWIQMLDIEDAVISYYPHSCRLSRANYTALMNEALTDCQKARFLA